MCHIDLCHIFITTRHQLGGDASGAKHQAAGASGRGISGSRHVGCGTEEKGSDERHLLGDVGEALGNPLGPGGPEWSVFENKHHSVEG